MSPSKIYQPQDITAAIAYWRERSDGSLPTEEDSLKIMRQGKEVDAREMTIHDIRNIQDNFTLDKNGFQVWTLPETPEYTKDNKAIEDNQYPEIVETLEKLTGGSCVRIFGHIVRDQLDLATEEEKLDPKAFGKDGPRSPTIRPHTDFDAGTAPSFFSATKADLGSYIASGKRWQVIGVWRPLKTIQRNPLALCDAVTVPDDDLVATPRDYGGVKGANSVLKHGRGDGVQHRWYWLPEQRPDEAWLFKHFDSLEEEGHARQCAHTSFDPPGTRDLPPRESVEFRAIVLY